MTFCWTLLLGINFLSFSVTSYAVVGRETLVRLVWLIFDVRAELGVGFCCWKAPERLISMRFTDFLLAESLEV